MTLPGIYKNASNKEFSSYTLYLCRRFSLFREVADTTRQFNRDRVELTLMLWPHFYFNYIYSPDFDKHIEELLNDKENFRDRLIYLLNMHYIGSVLSFNNRRTANNEIKRLHLSEMQTCARGINLSKSSEPASIINDGLESLRYHDTQYLWGTAPPLGKFSTYYSPKSLLLTLSRRYPSLTK